MSAIDPARRARDARHRVARDRCRDARRAHDAARRRLALDGASGRRQRAAAVQGHGRALRRLRLRPRGGPRRSRADRALHDGRRRVRRRLHDGAARIVRRRRGFGRRSRRQPARRQRRGEFDGVRRDRRRRDGGVAAREGAFRDAEAAAIQAALDRAEAPFRRGKSADLEEIRERLHATMWDDAGIVRDAGGLERAARTLSGAGRRARCVFVACRVRAIARST